MASLSVEVHLFAAARAAVGASVVPAEEGSLDTVLDRLCEQFPAFAGVRPRCSFLIDGIAAGLGSDVPAGSRVDVLPPFAGG